MDEKHPHNITSWSTSIATSQTTVTVSFMSDSSGVSLDPWIHKPLTPDQ